jgi:hypothetical protein
VVDYDKASEIADKKQGAEKVMRSPEFVTPAAAKRRAGVQKQLKSLDSRFRGNDGPTGRA